MSGVNVRLPNLSASSLSLRRDGGGVTPARLIMGDGGYMSDAVEGVSGEGPSPLFLRDCAGRPGRLKAGDMPLGDTA